MPSSVVLSVCIDVGVFLCTISLSVWRAGMDYLKFMYRAASSASAAEYMTVFIIYATLRMAPLSGVSGGSLDMNKFPPSLPL